ncbi:MAG TPA: UDP-3-O-acyl-N-acetylglucosamine deacetylase, partial [Pseudobdellovibrionaceae bacterium]|nr:UDP-3-O-acyl-N-acetylglucosamine deacetylase [Pseudobdellovibrionaceae bacterium]
MFLQKTVKRKVEIKGYGIHSGEPCTLSFCPAPVDTGVYLRRVDLPNKPYIRVAAQDVTATSQATTLGNDIFQVSTVEHCLSALSALRIDNLLIDLDGSEI